LDILTTKSPGGDSPIARFLKVWEGIQQVEIDVTDVDRVTEILRSRFQVEPIYSATRSGANGTRVEFFLVTSWNGAKVLVELVEVRELRFTPISLYTDGHSAIHFRCNTSSSIAVN